MSISAGSKQIFERVLWLKYSRFLRVGFSFLMHDTGFA
jgi:hypothetical protein